jgi:hypothetical protein
VTRAQDPLDEQPFSYQRTKGGQIRIAHRGKVVTTLGGRDAVRFLARVDGATLRAAQLAMAKATGHFKHGNEHAGKTRR